MPTAELENVALGPEEIGPMTAAYKKVLRTLGVTERDPLAEVIAKKIIEVVWAGEQNPERIVRRTILELGMPAPPKLRKHA
ncbi:MAG: hypothetical protein ACREC1_02055 [Methylovirgula sp.]